MLTHFMQKTELDSVDLLVRFLAVGIHAPNDPPDLPDSRGEPGIEKF